MKLINMKLVKLLYIHLLFFLSLNAHALIIKDVISVNKILELDWRTYDFDITKHGYNHLTDTINFVTLTYDFSKMVDEFDDYDDYTTMETIQLNSYIFDGRSNIYNLDPGILTQRLHWTKDESYCQKENYDTGECEFNLDLKGTARESLAVYNGNIWLGDVTFSVDVTRTNLPESSPFILVALGLIALSIGVKFRSPAMRLTGKSLHY